MNTYKRKDEPKSKACLKVLKDGGWRKYHGTSQKTNLGAGRMRSEGPANDSAAGFTRQDVDKYFSNPVTKEKSSGKRGKEEEGRGRRCFLAKGKDKERGSKYERRNKSEIFRCCCGLRREDQL